ncbi:hypothetical protein CDAR_48931 [Caerostris darwini]|uniref:Uncharacterized protein n=1 Tax=Caerostris darwini TaxID=1538125 RepID=A0AAV4NIZ2_9ARAC|nr:hypothetical protein CDAR_48931 [Caerostris darwini]
MPQKISAIRFPCEKQHVEAVSTRRLCDLMIGSEAMCVGDPPIPTGWEIRGWIDLLTPDSESNPSNKYFTYVMKAKRSKRYTTLGSLEWRGERSSQ